ncbi:dienelactone hydrolase family protein [Pseudenhygromyxa sp. WMMC2535]|uniref:dienelactone hydrolase family protein n=1 Tax=Pseudenhygromyxa sp. WMMC2535 TaxID=2712867 RepID=UPI00155698FA|nr:dienelactone hydrolase family protein [Pseudenhygromyxa sp. WMMC2535]NVB38912.1 dienelactone hydrolase family protein [Pseudenhygromyxa sp. WMMC2535]
MCDDTTEAENEVYLQRQGLRRRELALGAGAAAAVLLAGCKRDSAAASTTEPSPEAGSAEPQASVEASAEASAAVAVEGRMVSVEMAEGSAEAYFVAPTSGRHPGVLIWPDIAGLRQSFMDMATRLAEAGYAVLAVNQYYRSSKLPVLESFSEWRTEEGKAKIAPMIEALSAEGIASDGAAFVAWLDQQAQVDTGRKIGTTGYCMGGPFTFRTAAARADRVGAIGSFHGGGLVTQEADSPHQLIPEMRAALLICVAENDDERDPEAKTTLHQAAEVAGRTAEIEVYPAQHGWCVTDSPVYDEVQAERAWARLLATFEAEL